MGEMRNAYKILVGRPVGRRPLGRPRRLYTVPPRIAFCYHKREYKTNSSSSRRV